MYEETERAIEMETGAHLLPGNFASTSLPTVTGTDRETWIGLTQRVGVGAAAAVELHLQ